MTIAKHLKVERGEDYLNVEYEKVKIEAKALKNGFYSVEAYELYRQTKTNMPARGRKITEQPLNVLLDSSESRFTDLWIVLNGWQNTLTNAQCAELDTIIEDALNGILPQEPQKEEPAPAYQSTPFTPPKKEPGFDWIRTESDLSRTRPLNLYKGRIK